MNWLLYTVGAVMFFTALNLLQKVLAEDGKNPRAMAFVFNSGGALFASVLYLILRPVTSSSPIPVQGWMVLLFAALGYSVFERLRFIIANLLDASVFATVTNISIIVAFTAALLFYHEHITLYKGLGLICIISSIFIVTYQKRVKEISQKGIFLAVIASISLGLAWMLDKKGAQYFSAETYNILIWSAPLLFIYLPSIPLKDIITVVKQHNWKIFLLSLLNVIGYFLQLKALGTTEATRVIPIIQTSLLLTVLSGIIILHEREHIPQKIIAGCMAIIGVFLLL